MQISPMALIEWEKAKAGLKSVNIAIETSVDESNLEEVETLKIFTDKFIEKYEEFLAM